MPCDIVPHSICVPLAILFVCLLLNLAEEITLGLKISIPEHGTASTVCFHNTVKPWSSTGGDFFFSH